LHLGTHASPGKLHFPNPVRQSLFSALHLVNLSRPQALAVTASSRPTMPISLPGALALLQVNQWRWGVRMGAKCNFARQRRVP